MPFCTTAGVLRGPVPQRIQFQTNEQPIRLRPSSLRPASFLKSVYGYAGRDLEVHQPPMPLLPPPLPPNSPAKRFGRTRYYAAVLAAAGIGRASCMATSAASTAETASSATRRCSAVRAGDNRNRHRIAARDLLALNKQSRRRGADVTQQSARRAGLDGVPNCRDPALGCQAYRA